jgi:sec-independent protein translocase protein TatB
MEFLGIGAPEFVFIIIIALIVLGPKDMQKAGKTIGVWLNKLIHSDGWKLFQQTSREIRNLPTQMMREANLDLSQVEKDLREQAKPFAAKPLSSYPTPASLTTLSSPPPPPAESAPEADPANPPGDESSHA